MTKDKQIIQDWIDEISTNGKNLTKWEEDFFDSVAEQFSERKWISDKQEEILERIYAEKTPN